MSYLRSIVPPSACALFVACIFASGALAASSSPFGADDLDCFTTKPTGVAKQRALVRAVLVARKSRLSASEAIDKLSAMAVNPAVRESEERNFPELIAVEAAANDLLSKVYSPQFYPNPDSPSNWQTYFGSRSGEVSIMCKAESEQTATGAGWEFRVRGISPDIGYTQNGGSFSGGFSTASKASVSLNDNGLNKTSSFALQAAVGPAWTSSQYQLGSAFATQYEVVPYVGANYNSSTAQGEPTKYTAQSLNFGVALGAADIGAPLLPASALTLAPDYLINQQDGSRLASFHFSYTPYILNAINEPFNSAKIACSESGMAALFGCAPYATIKLSILSDAGDYTDQGTGANRTMNENYVRAGGQGGFDIALKNWYDLTVTDTDLYGFSGFRRDLNDFQASFSFYFGTQNVFGLTAAYKNGLVEQTAQREQSWTLGLTAKY